MAHSGASFSTKRIDGAERPRRRRRRGRRLWLVLLALGLATMIAGAALILGPLWGVWHRGQADASALQGWNNGGSTTLTGPPKSGASDAGKTICGSNSPDDYALVNFNDPSQYHYAGVSGDGTWDLLNSRSMVHYHGTPDPGQQGNVIIAFHREPNYEHINMLNVGSTVTVQDRACHSFVYKISGRWDIPPEKVTQLSPTNGYDMTLITCDPWWQDYNRLVWRATLVPGNGTAQSGSGQTGPVANPTF